MVTEETALQVSVTAFPLIALVATYAVDSIGEDDGIKYRILVLVLGLSAVARVAPAIFTGLAGATTDIHTNELMLNLGESVGLVVLLTVVVMLKESLEGYENSRETLIVLSSTFLALLVMFRIVLPALEGILH